MEIDSSQPPDGTIPGKRGLLESSKSLSYVLLLSCTPYDLRSNPGHPYERAFRTIGLTAYTVSQHHAPFFTGCLGNEWPELHHATNPTYLSDE
jgi:hypothetical protein